MEYKVAETFVSINGEGQRAGELAVFIRFAGCNLSCGYCDTAWANREDTPFRLMTAEKLTEYVADSSVANVTVTGGEPLLQPGIFELLERLGSLPGLRIEIETNGSMDIAPFLGLRNRPAFTLDYKLPGSGMEGNMRTENYQLLEQQDTVKFVISGVQDLERAREVIAEYRLQGRCGIYFSPVFGMIEPEVIVNDMISHRLNQVHMQLQLHKYIWDPNRRSV